MVKAVEFQVAVAVNAGVGSCTVFIGYYEAVHNLFFKISGEIKHVIRDSKIMRYAPCILHIIQRTAAFFAAHTGIFILEKLHGDTDAVISMLLHQVSGH